MKYKTQNGWTKAKILERLKEKTGNKRCLGGNGFGGVQLCRYRALSGRGCFVGAFIPDEMYSLGMEGNIASVLFRKFPQLIEKMPLPEDAMESLQRIHDEEGGPDDRIPDAAKWLDENVEDAT
jgi:hypothetical protein